MINMHLHLREGWKPCCAVCGNPITEQQIAVSYRGYFANGNQNCTSWYHENCTRKLIDSLAVDLKSIDSIKAHTNSTYEGSTNHENDREDRGLSKSPGR